MGGRSAGRRSGLLEGGGKMKHLENNCQHHKPTIGSSFNSWLNCKCRYCGTPIKLTGWQAVLRVSLKVISFFCFICFPTGLWQMILFPEAERSLWLTITILLSRILAWFFSWLLIHFIPWKWQEDFKREDK